MFSIAIAALLMGAQVAEDDSAQEAPETAAETQREQPEAEAEEEEEVICRRRIIPSERVGQRFRTREVCQTREEWEAERTARRR